jgi:hypothetical protein
MKDSRIGFVRIGLFDWDIYFDWAGRLFRSLLGFCLASQKVRHRAQKSKISLWHVLGATISVL